MFGRQDRNKWKHCWTIIMSKSKNSKDSYKKKMGKLKKSILNKDFCNNKTSDWAVSLWDGKSDTNGYKKKKIVSSKSKRNREILFCRNIKSIRFRTIKASYWLIEIKLNKLWEKLNSIKMLTIIYSCKLMTKGGCYSVAKSKTKKKLRRWKDSGCKE